MIIRQFDIFGGYEDFNVEDRTKTQLSGLAVDIPKFLKEQLQAACLDQHITMTKVVTKLIQDWVDKHN